VLIAAADVGADNFQDDTMLALAADGRRGYTRPVLDLQLGVLDFLDGNLSGAQVGDRSV
jgi:hypothetical protein